MEKYSIRRQISQKEKEKLSVYPELMQHLLINRGIINHTEAERFLHPDYDNHTYDPFLMKGMKKAVSRIIKAIENEEKIIIYSDYDCDGIPGGAILHDFFKELGYDNVENYIPHRHVEGYGFNIPSVKWLADGGANLIITVDCGISDNESVKQASGLGVDVIITDHHLPAEVSPPAYAIINPRQSRDKYPFKELAGAAIAFKLIQALIKKLPSKFKAKIRDGWEKWLLDMVGLATIADMVSLTGENRVLAHYGLKVLRKSPRIGFMRLCRKIRLEQKNLTEDDIGFMIAPRINAASRMDKPQEALELLITHDENAANELSEYLDKINNERKGIVASMVKEVKKRIVAFSKPKEVIVMGNPQWKPALLGLVANSVAEEYERPVFLWGREGSDVIKGSCRSDGSVNVVRMMSSVENMFIGYGGHAYSGGFSISSERVHTLEEVLCDSYEKLKTSAVNDQTFIDKKLSLDDINWSTYKVIEQLSPFGVDNPKPLFLFGNIEIAGVNHFGRDKNHLRLEFKNSGGKVISAIGFFMKEDSFDIKLETGRKIDLIATMEKSTFRNFPELRLRIVNVL